MKIKNVLEFVRKIEAKKAVAWTVIASMTLLGNLDEGTKSCTGEYSIQLNITGWVMIVSMFVLAWMVISSPQPQDKEK